MHHIVAELLEQAIDVAGGAMTSAEVEAVLTEPKSRDHGDVAFPCFLLAKSLRKSPVAIAQSLEAALVAGLENSAEVTSAVAVGPYVNFTLNAGARAESVLTAALQRGYGSSSFGAGKTVGIDFSSPNIAKPFGIGHLRSTSIGNALGNIHRMLGYRVVGINHLGDWGTQFGKLMAAFEERGDRQKLDDDPIQHLYDLYVWFHQQVEVNPEYEEMGRDWFRRLEAGDEQAMSYWREFRALSLREFERIYARLGVSFDHDWGEAFYEEMLEPVVNDLAAAGLLQESEGALVVDIGEDLPPCLVRKSDGATLYATRDLAAARYRHQELQFSLFLYVVGAPQATHFEQVFRVLNKMGYDWADSLKHVPFGHIHGISTRQGTLVFLEDILDEGAKRVRAFLQNEKPEYDEAKRNEIAEQIAIGAVMFYDLSRNRIKDYDFSWDHMLLGMQRGDKGNTGIKLQYTYARLCSVEAQFTDQFGELPASVAYSRLTEPDAKAIVATVERWPATVEQAADQLEPAVISRYAISVCDAFNSFYSHEDKANYRIVSDDAELSAARTAMVRGARLTLQSAMEMIGVPHPTQI